MPKVILVLIDGCRPEALSSSTTPALDSLMAGGAFTRQARTVEPPITLPTHFSLFTSRMPSQHGVFTNGCQPLAPPAAAGLVETVKHNGLYAAAIHSWEELNLLAPCNSFDEVYYRKTDHVEGGDEQLMRVGLDIICARKPDFCFIYLGRQDLAGHAGGWLSPQYFKALKQADDAVALLVDGLAAGGLTEQYVVVVQSDHGGQGKQHKQPLAEVMTIPWMARGPGIRAGHAIKAGVQIVDTAPTIARILGIEPHCSWIGNVPEEIFVPQPVRA